MSQFNFSSIVLIYNLPEVMDINIFKFNKNHTCQLLKVQKHIKLIKLFKTIFKNVQSISLVNSCSSTPP